MRKLKISLFVLLLFLVGCGQSDSGNDTEASEEFTFIANTTTEPQSFHPDRVSDDGAWPINQNIFSRLLKLNAFDEFVPDLAKEWEFSDDELSITFHLHEDVKWHDGEDFSSEDVKYTFDTMIEEEWAHASSFSSVESIETPDENTVVFNLDTPDASILARLSWYGTFILPKHIYEDTDHATNSANQDPIGTGPFEFESYESGVSVNLVKNEDYFDGDIEVDKLVFRIIPDESTLYQAFLNEEVDYLSALPANNEEDLDDDDSYEFVQSLGINRTYITFNLDDADFGKQEVRQAVAHALDQDAVFDRIGGSGVRSEYLISPVFEDYVNDTYTLPETNIDKAMELLEEAGYTKNADGYYLEADFDFFTGGDFGDIASIVAANLEKAGIKLKLNAQEMSAWQQKVMDEKDFSITMLAGYQGPDVAGVSNRVHTEGSTNIAGYSNEELDEALDNGVRYSDTDKRKEYYDEVQRIMSEDLPLIFIMENGYKTPIRKDFTGTPYQDKTKASGEFSGVKRAE